MLPGVQGGPCNVGPSPFLPENLPHVVIGMGGRDLSTDLIL